ncbi:hypothetical protein [Christensenella minuta]|uniref:hypothetical protein n=1 Tax=Christensenella minuta TaxID=626937 RepID=UPI001A9A4DE9|nr:hypothetical protein [Christensenella minuta]
MRPRVKYRMIEQCACKYPVTQMCAFYEVSRSGYYRYLKYKHSPDRDAMLAQMIAECHRNEEKFTVTATYSCGSNDTKRSTEIPKRFFG